MKIQVIKNFIKDLTRILFFLVSLNAAGQNGNILKINSAHDFRIDDKTILNDDQITFLRKIYSEKVEVPRELINGKEYEPYYLRSEIKPLLFPLKERSASITTKTRRYTNLTLQYDTFLDEVIYTDNTRTINFRFPQIALNKDILEGFNLYFKDDSLIFRYFRLPECSEKNLEEGFYEVVYEGKSSYIIKHESSFYERQGLPNYKYSPKNYISTGGEFYKIKTIKSLLRLFDSRSGVVKAYIHSARIRMRKADKEEVLSVIKFYDSLKKTE